MSDLPPFLSLAVVNMLQPLPGNGDAFGYVGVGPVQPCWIDPTAWKL